MRTERIQHGALQHQPLGGAMRPSTLFVEWAPTSSSTVPIRSTWRDAVGALLTDRRITFYQRQGRYGDKARLRILANDKLRVERSLARKMHTRARQRTRERIMAKYV